MTTIIVRGGRGAGYEGSGGPGVGGVMVSLKQSSNLRFFRNNRQCGETKMPNYSAIRAGQGTPDVSDVQQTFEQTMAPNGPYQPETPDDVHIMTDEAKNELHSVMHFYNRPEERIKVLQDALNDIRKTRQMISSGDKQAFQGNADVGYYFADPKSPTGSGLMSPGAPTWNPNRAQSNLAIRQKMYEVALHALGVDPK